MLTIDLNCDLGEGFGIYEMPEDRYLLEEASSVNIACGFHAGDPSLMRKTVRMCMERGTAIGAHPGLPDRYGFGRREMAISPQDAYDLVLYQIGALDAFVRSEGGVLHHVKPHGALYNMAAKNRALADAIAQAVYRYHPGLVLYGLAGSELVKAAQSIGLACAGEAFADRTYRADGTLTPRSMPNAVLESVEDAVGQSLQIVKEGRVRTADGTLLVIRADTLCVHGDGSQALALLRRLRSVLQQEGFKVAPVPPGGGYGQ